MENKSILIVEDEILVATSIRKKLERLGYNIAEIADTCNDAVRIAKSAHPDLVLMDIRLSDDTDGIEAAIEIRDAIDVPIIFLTAMTDESTVARAKEVKPFSYLVKPFSDMELKSNIDVALSRHALEAKIKESEKRYKIVSELSSDFAYALSVDDAGRLVPVWVTKGAEKITGYTQEELQKNFNLFDIPFRADIRRVENFKRSLMRGEAAGIEYRIVLKDGSIRWMRNRAKPVYDQEKERTVEIYGTVEDISELKRIESIERAKEQNYQSMIKRMNDALVIVDRTGIITFVNDRLCSMIGYEKYEIVGETFRELFCCSDDLSEPVDWDAHMTEQSSPFEAKIRHKSGSPFYVLVTPTVLHDAKGHFSGSFSIIRNIEPIKEKEHILELEKEESRVQYINVFENSQIALVEKDLSRTVSLLNEKRRRNVKDIYRYIQNHPEFQKELYESINLKNANKAALRLFEAENIDQLRGGVLSLVLPEPGGLFIDIINLLMENKNYIAGEITTVTMQGNDLELLVTLSVPRKPDGLKQTIFTFTDITEKKRKDREWKEKEQRYRAFFEQSPYSMQVFNRKGELRMVNSTFFDVWGIDPHSEETLIGNYNILQDTHPAILSLKQYIQRGFDGEKVQLPPMEYIPKNGQEKGLGGKRRFWFRGHIYTVSGGEDSVSYIVFIHEDITAQIELEKDKEKQDQIFKSIVDASQEAIMIIDENRNIEYMSEKAASLFRYTDRDGCVGKSVFSVFSPKDLNRAIENTKKIFAKGGSDWHRYTLKRRDGSLLNSDIRATIVQSPGGGLKTMVAYIHEVKA